MADRCIISVCLFNSYALFWGGGEKYELKKNVFILPELKVSVKIKFSTQNDFLK